MGSCFRKKCLPIEWCPPIRWIQSILMDLVSNRSSLDISNLWWRKIIIVSQTLEGISFGNDKKKIWSIQARIASACDCIIPRQSELFCQKFGCDWNMQPTHSKNPRRIQRKRIDSLCNCSIAWYACP